MVPSARASSTAPPAVSPPAPPIPPEGPRSISELPTRDMWKRNGSSAASPETEPTENGSPSTWSGTPGPRTSTEIWPPCASRIPFEKPPRVSARCMTFATATTSSFPSSIAGSTASVCKRSRQGSGAPSLWSHRSEPPP
eukprot:scaffold27246_cov114-Isochrysis_galbana.AAC.5